MSRGKGYGGKSKAAPGRGGGSESGKHDIETIHEHKKTNNDPYDPAASTPISGCMQPFNDFLMGDFPPALLQPECGQEKAAQTNTNKKCDGAE